VLSVLGMSLSLSEAQHLALLGAAVSLSVVLSAWRSWRSRRLWPVSVALGGAGLIALGHLVSALHDLESVGVVVLLVGGLSEHLRLARRPARSGSSERSKQPHQHAPAGRSKSIG
jgi:hypothetical protein